MVKTALIIYVRFATRTHTVNIYIGRIPLSPIGFLPIYIYSAGRSQNVIELEFELSRM